MNWWRDSQPSRLRRTLEARSFGAAGRLDLPAVRIARKAALLPSIAKEREQITFGSSYRRRRPLATTPSRTADFKLRHYPQSASPGRVTSMKRGAVTGSTLPKSSVSTSAAVRLAAGGADCLKFDPLARRGRDSRNVAVVPAVAAVDRVLHFLATSWLRRLFCVNAQTCCQIGVRRASVEQYLCRGWRVGRGEAGGRSGEVRPL